MLFSHRKGLKKVIAEFQLDSISSELRNGLWDAVTTSFLSNVLLNDYDPPSRDSSIKILGNELWHSYFKKPIDTIPAWGDFYKNLRKYFFNCEWNEAYDFIEFVAKNYSITKTNVYDYHAKELEKERIERFISMCNSVLERENSAYRFVNHEITEITSKDEIAAIEEASQTAFKSTNTHIESALSLMTDRKKPDFRNSIKESISAVEATCNSLLKDRKNTLGQALDELENRGVLSLHKAEKKAYQQLYGYTSDANGIRHALLEESNLDFDDAKFMLVSCSAFCNYLISKVKD